jgi:8-oxo-dGTP pyrophosphatase MutT (NUDIX family)
VEEILHAVAMGADRAAAREKAIGTSRSSTFSYRPERLLRLAQLRKLRKCEQVAAICYRLGRKGVEFLLVRTRGACGRWTFPKGSAERGLTHAQAAALEAFEEAGVHGRIEEASFTSYIRGKRRDDRKSRRATDKEIVVNAHLCEVSRLSVPQESGRDRTWFSPHDARQRLREGRDAHDGASFARVVDRALARIELLHDGTGIADFRQGRRLSSEASVPRDALQKVRFEAFEGPYREEGWSMAHPRPKAIMAAKSRQILQGEVLEFVPSHEKKAKALGTGARNR